MINIDHIRHNLYHRCSYDGSGLVLGVSGGADSMFLLHVLMQTEERDKLHVLHVNHNIRGAEALADQEHVLEYCRQHGISCNAVTRDIPTEAQDKRISLEEAGRIARYEELRREAHRRGYKFIACAHHSNDRAETVLMNILRGTGLRGLRGIDYVSGDILRPLLDVTRTQIMEYIHEHNIPYVTDSTNIDNAYRRNAVRNNLFAYVEDNYGVDLVDRLNSLADLAREDSDCLERMAEEVFRNALVEKSYGSKVVLDARIIGEADTALAKRAIRRAIGTVKGDLVDIAHSHVEAILSIADKTGKQVPLPHGLVVTTSYNKITICYGDMQECHQQLPLPHMTQETLDYSNGNARLYKKLNSRPMPGQYMHTMCFDADAVNRLGEPPVLRYRLTGDRIRLDNGGTKKLKDWMIDSKIPAGLRDGVWVIACGSTVLGAPQYRAFGGFAPSPASKKVLVLRID